MVNMPIRNRRAINTVSTEQKKKKRYFCRPAAKYTIAGEIWVCYSPLEREVRDE
jgi:hypothetical protein